MNTSETNNFGAEINPEAEFAKGRELMKNVFLAIKTIEDKKLDEEKLEIEYKNTRERIVSEHPESSLLIDALFGVKDIVKANRILSFYRGQALDKEKKSIVRSELIEAAEWQCMATELVKNFVGDRKFASMFWDAYHDLYEIYSASEDETRSANGYQRGVIGQVGAYHLLKACGLNPHLATPKDDAFKGIDLECDLPNVELVAQVKYTSKIHQPIIEIVGEAFLPALGVFDGEQRTYIANEGLKAMGALKVSCQKIADRTGHRARGLFLALPDGSFDSQTGEIDPIVLDNLKKDLAKKIPERERHATIDDLIEAWGAKNKN